MTHGITIAELFGGKLLTFLKKIYRILKLIIRVETNISVEKLLTKKDTLNDKEIKKLHVLLASTYQQMDKFCQ